MANLNSSIYITLIYREYCIEHRALNRSKDDKRSDSDQVNRMNLYAVSLTNNPWTFKLFYII